jgi:hypothetical protein
MSIPSFNALAEERYALIDHTHASSGSSGSSSSNAHVEAATQAAAITQAKALLNNNESIRIMYSDTLYGNPVTLYKLVFRNSTGNYFISNFNLLNPT